MDSARGGSAPTEFIVPGPHNSDGPRNARETAGRKWNTLIRNEGGFGCQRSTPDAGIAGTVEKKGRKKVFLPRASPSTSSPSAEQAFADDHDESIVRAVGTASVFAAV